MLIQTTESRRRALRATIDGIGPEIAEILQSKGIDPRNFAAKIRSNRAERSTLGAQLRRPTRRTTLDIPDAPGAVKAALDRADVTQRTLLNEVALESMEDDFINEVVAPVQLVDVASGKQYLQSRTANRAEVDDNLGERARANKIPSGLTSVNYDCKPYGLESDVNEQLAGEHPLLENVANETRRVASAVYLQQELRVVPGKLFTSTTYNSSNRASLSAGYQWNGGASANPIRNMNAAIAAMPVPPTHLVMSLPVMHAITENDDLRAILSANHEGLFTADELALYWGIEEAVVNNGQYAAASDPSTMTRILSSTDLALIHANPDKMMRTFLRQYRLRQGARGFVSTARYDGGEAGVAGYTFPKVAHQTDVVTVDDTYGYLLQNVKRS